VVNAATAQMIGYYAVLITLIVCAYRAGHQALQQRHESRLLHAKLSAERINHDRDRAAKLQVLQWAHERDDQPTGNGHRGEVQEPVVPMDESHSVSN
jgi:hypothetical protein